MSARLSGAPSAARDAQARRIVDRHCVSCHSDHPSIAAFPIAAGGVELDTAEQMRRYAGRINVRVLVQRDMPLLDKTGMTEAERDLLGRWAAATAGRD